MAQLEISPSGPRRRHDLCPLDADPETPTGGRGAELDRRVAGGPAHGRWRPVRRGRGRSQGETPRRGEGAPPPGADGSSSTPAAAGKAATQHGQRASAGDSRHRRPTRFRGQTGARGRHHKAEAAQASVGRQLGCARGASREPSASSRAGTGLCPSLAGSLFCRQARWSQRGHPPAAPNLVAKRGLRGPRGTRSPGGSAASAWMRRWSPPPSSHPRTI